MQKETKAKGGISTIKMVKNKLEKASAAHAGQAKALGKVIDKKKLLLGGLLTKGIKSAYKAYRKAGGRKTSDIMKQPVKGAGKRSDAKDDVKFGIRLHGKGRYLSQREINKLMKIMGGLTKKELRTEKDLTPKQKMFVEIMVQDHGQITQAEALKRAGYDCKDINSARSTASQLINRRINPHVAKYYDKRFEQEIKKYESDNLRRYKRFERLADKAEKKEQFAAAINAEFRSGQLAGAFIDRKEVRVTGLEGMSREELENKLKELSEKIDGHNAKTIEVESEDAALIKKG